MPRPSALAGVDAFPRVRLGHLPTPLDPAPHLGAALGVELWIKRDDCTGLAFGGNKVRQLEFYLGEAQARGVDTVLITGAVQSNFVRVAAAGARVLGMEIHIQLEERVDDEDALYRRSGNVLLDRLLGARLHSFPVGEDEAAADEALERLARSLEREGRRPYVIHLGIDHAPIGGLGYVLAAGEVMEQVCSRGIGLDALVCASGSALTHAGLLVGMRASGETAPVHGICVRREASPQRARVERRAAELAAMIGCAGVVRDHDIDVCDAVLAPGYGRLSDAVGEAMSMAARLEGLLLDPVYTGRVMAGLVAQVAFGPHRGREAACSSCTAAARPRSSDTPTGSSPGSRRHPGPGAPTRRSE